MNKRINILFLGGAKRYSLAERFIEAGGMINNEINIYSYELNKDVPISGIASIIVGLKWNDPDIETHLLNIIKKNKINIVLPFLDPAISLTANLKLKLKNKVFIPVSEKEICDIHYDKKLAYVWFVKQKIPVPSTENDRFPKIAKPRKGSASKGITNISTEEDLKEFRQKNVESEFLIQQYIDAVEFSVDAYVDASGRILGIVSRKRLEITSGEVTKSITERNVKIIDYSRKILQAGNFRGPITIQFLLEQSTGEIFVLEVNPRFGGGVINSIEAGFNIPLLILNEYLNIENKIVDNWRNNLLMMRAHREVFVCK
jgi:carbamoyl-phosphate synthase large subunit